MFEKTLVKNLRKLWNIYRREGIEMAARSFYDYTHRSVRKSAFVRGEKQFNFFTNSRFYYHSLIFNSPADPWRTLRVDPSKIKYQTDIGYYEWGLGQIKQGDWEERVNRIDQHRVVQGLHDRFVKGLDWEDTTYVREVKQKYYSKGIPKGNYTSIREFIDIRCSYVDELFESIKTEGYRPNHEGGHHVPDTDTRSGKKRSHQRLEPLVVIDKGGEIYWRDGYHRFAIANILDIDSIPVYVVVRHKKWQNKRDRLGTVSSTDVGASLTHPDLQDVIS